ncbi:MAG: hypothetical protein WC969_02300 [Elusimicrobiota bacterium]|jgi:tetratricopeptide (TPR) repeat protein
MTRSPFLSALTLLVLLLRPACAVELAPDAQRLLQKGLDGIYRMDFDGADRALRQVAERSGHPYAYLGLVGSSMTRFVYGTEQSDLSLLTDFDRRVEEAAEASERWLKAHPNDPQGLLALGASYGIAARVQAQRLQWIKAYISARRGIKNVRAALEADPKLGDAWLGLGMYDYYSDTYPRFIGVLAKIVLRGSRDRGIEELRRCAKEGSFARTAAQLILVEVFTEDRFGSRDPREAVRLMDDIRGKYPRSAMLHAAELVALFEDGRMELFNDGVEEFLNRVRDGGYEPMQLAKGLLMRGTVRWSQGRRAEALEDLRAGAQVRYKGGPARWAVWSRIRSAQLLDLLGRRDEALEEYRAAAAEPDHWGLLEFAEAGLKKPWTAEKPGHISPF